MKKYGKIIVHSVTCGFAVLLAGCAGVDMNKLAKQQQLKSNPSPLELHGDSVKFELSAVVPVKMLKKQLKYTVHVDYKAFEERVSVDKIIFNGADFPNAATEPPTLSKKMGFAYNDKLKKGNLIIVGEVGSATNATAKTKKTPDITVTSGIITTPLLVQPVYPSVMADHGYDNREQLQPTVVNFYFQKRIAKLDNKELKGNRAKFFEKFIATKYVTRTVNIIGTHSPEGYEAFNEKLSEQRAMTIESYYRQTMKKFNYGKVADSITFVVKGKVKDWSDFKLKLDSNKTLKPEQKSEILAIVDSDEGTFHQKELKLQKLKSYKVLEKEIYPKLRNAQTEVLTVKAKKSDAQIYLIAKKIADGTANANETLTPQELLYAATLTPSPEEQEAILLAATKRDASYEAHNNLGALYLSRAVAAADANTKNDLVEKARVQLEIAVNKTEGAEALLNLSSVKLMKDDKAGSAESLEKAKSKSASADVTKGINAFQGVLDIKAGKYDAAVQNLSNAGTDATITFNRGLAQLCKKDNQSAKSTLEDAVSKNDKMAVYYYAAAIASARLNDAEAMATNLRKCFQLDDSYKRKALDDLEFINMVLNPKFVEALK